MKPSVMTIKLPLANAYLVRGERAIIVDTGAPGDAPAILRAAARHRVSPRDIALILLTHAHVDHFGGAAALRDATGAPIAIHPADAPLLASGRNPDLAATGVEGRIFRPFLPWSAPPLTPDLLIDAAFDLHSFGVAGEIIATPGHSAGSISLLLPGGALIAGDLLRGGFMGGRLLPATPNLPFYVDQPAQLSASIERALALPITTLYVGHGGPVPADAARRRYATGRLTIRKVFA
jgi:glyoxylase-like metal-dependent hydrolase (beta-lactamase superfamily II)